MKPIITIIAVVIVVIAALLWYWTRKSRPAAAPTITRRVEASIKTYDDTIDAYAGGKTLLVAVHADWASVWPITRNALSGVDRSLYDIKLIEADRNRQQVRDLGVKIVPIVIVYRGGREVARVPNMTSLNQLPRAD